MRGRVIGRLGVNQNYHFRPNDCNQYLANTAQVQSLLRTPTSPAVQVKSVLSLRKGTLVGRTWLYTSVLGYQILRVRSAVRTIDRQRARWDIRHRKPVTADVVVAR